MNEQPPVTDDHPIAPAAAVEFLMELARYFDNRSTHEDMAHWTNLQNASICRRIALMILASSPTTTPKATP